VSGALRREELTNTVIKDIQQKDDIIVIIIPKTKTNVSRSFVITKEEWVATVQLYLQIRLKITKIADRLFLKYEKGKCCAVPVGINNIGSIPSKIATFLNLPNPSQYTGHCFRRSSATLLANRGGDLLTLKRHGRWKSGTVAESYVADSLKRKIDVAHMMTEAGPSGSKRPAFQVHSGPSTIQEDSSIEVGYTTNKSTTEVNQLMPGLFSDVQNCTINVTINLNK
jgi:integrase